MLKKYRKQIDKIDRKFVKLFEKRMGISKRIGEFKKANNMEIFDAKRETEILSERTSQIKNNEYVEYCKEFFEKIILISKEIQNKSRGNL